MRRPNVTLANVDPRVARKTAELRAEWRADKSHDAENKNIKSPDAIILATAVLYGATVLHSTEPKFHRHSKTALVSGLRITMPVLDQGQKVFELASGEQPASEAANESEETTPVAITTEEAIAVATDAGASPPSGDEHQAAHVVASEQQATDSVAPPKVLVAVVPPQPDRLDDVTTTPISATSTTTVVVAEKELPSGSEQIVDQPTEVPSDPKPAGPTTSGVTPALPSA